MFVFVRLKEVRLSIYIENCATQLYSASDVAASKHLVWNEEPQPLDTFHIYGDVSLSTLDEEVISYLICNEGVIRIED